MDPNRYGGLSARMGGYGAEYNYNESTQDLEPTFEGVYQHAGAYPRAPGSPGFGEPPNNSISAPIQIDEDMQAPRQIEQRRQPQFQIKRRALEDVMNQRREREDIHQQMQANRDRTVEDLKSMRDGMLTKVHGDFSDVIQNFQTRANDNITTAGYDPTARTKRGAQIGGSTQASLRIKDTVIDRLRTDLKEETRAREREVKKLDQMTRKKDKIIDKLQADIREEKLRQDMSLSQIKSSYKDQLDGKDIAMKDYQREAEAELKSKGDLARRVWKHMENQVGDNEELIRQLREDQAELIEQARRNDPTIRQLQQEFASQPQQEDGDGGQVSADPQQKLDRIKALASALVLTPTAKGEGDRKRKRVGTITTSPSEHEALFAEVFNPDKISADNMVGVESTTPAARSQPHTRPDLPLLSGQPIIPPLSVNGGYLDENNEWIIVEDRFLPRDLFPAITAVDHSLGARREALSPNNLNCVNMIAQQSECQNNSVDGNRAACMGCAKSGKPCIRFVGNDLLVVPVPTVWRGDKTPKDLEFWVRPAMA